MIKPPEIVLPRFNLTKRLCMASRCLNVLTVALWVLAAYCVPVVVKAQAYDRMLIVNAAAIPADVNQFVKNEYEARHHPKPIRKPKHV